MRAVSPLVELGVSIGRSGQETSNDEEPSSIHLEVSFLPDFLFQTSDFVPSGRER